MSEPYNFDDMIEALTEEAESLEGIRGSTNAPALRDAIDWMKQTRASLAEAERERDEARKYCRKHCLESYMTCMAYESALAVTEGNQDALREALAPFALFASALKNLKPHYPVLQYGHQSLSAASFYDARKQFPELEALHTKSKP